LFPGPSDRSANVELFGGGGRNRIILLLYKEIYLRDKYGESTGKAQYGNYDPEIQPGPVMDAPEQFIVFFSSIMRFHE
jgi:hypothetical protein